MFQMRVMTWLDWLGKISLLPISEPQVLAISPELTRENLSEAIHCVTPEGEIYRGARCLRYVGMRMPLLVPIAVFLWLPGVIWVAEIIYNWVSRNRYFLSKIFGCKGACKILPTRQREEKPLLRR